MESSTHGTDEVIDQHQHDAHQCQYDQHGVHIHRILLVHPQLLEMHLGNMEAWILLQALPEIERSLLVFLQRLVHLAEREVLEPCMAVRGFHVEGPLGQEHSVVIELQVEEHSRQLQEQVGMVCGDVEGFPEASWVLPLMHQKLPTWFSTVREEGF